MDSLKTLLQVAVESSCKCILSPEQAKQILEMQTEIDTLKQLNDVENLVSAFSSNMQEIAENLTVANQKDDELVISMVLAAKKLLSDFMVNYRLAAKGVTPNE